MKPQACVPCAKRKVRCDKGVPCSNCKRRKQDHCQYVEQQEAFSTSSQQRVKTLEAIVRSLGGDPVQNSQPLQTKTPESISSPVAQLTSQRAPQQSSALYGNRSRDPVIVEEDGQKQYHESWAWNLWLGKGHGVLPRLPIPVRQAPHALERLLHSKSATDLHSVHPPAEMAVTLWKAFRHRVYPVLTIIFERTLDKLQSLATSTQGQKTLGKSDRALCFSIYLISVISLSDSDCTSQLQQPRNNLVSKFQSNCEEAFAEANFLCANNVTMLQALTIYLMASLDRLSTQSLWSLMGVIQRNAERLGVHRDGALLGLNFVETEERRRLWWQLQHLDLALSVRCGLTSLSLTASWDTKLPLNIEESDIISETPAEPAERAGLTTMSYCLFVYWVIEQQRNAFKAISTPFELVWQSNKVLSEQSKGAVIDQLEAGLNDKFLRYCDPIKPVHVLLQFVARTLICGMRERMLHSLAVDPNCGQSSDDRAELLNACIMSLEYNVAIHSHPLIIHFRWLTKAFFPWHAFMCVLVEASQQTNAARVEKIWTLLADLYAANATLLELSDDRRKFHAAQLVVTSWKAYQNRPEHIESPKMLNLVSDLETRLDSLVSGSKENGSTTEGLVGDHVSDSEIQGVGNVFIEPDFDPILNFDLGFDDIDWDFWNSID